MARLPQPATVSPGRLILVYNTDGYRHEVGANLVAGTSVSDVAALRSDASDFAVAVAPMLVTTGAILGWKLTDLAGVTLYEENFAAPVPGEAGGPGNITAESFTRTAIGKGGPAIGLQAGQTKTVVFPGIMDPNSDGGTRRIATAIPVIGGDLIEFLNTSSTVGADRYGTKASYKPYVDLQLNAHIQKVAGL